MPQGFQTTRWTLVLRAASLNDAERQQLAIDIVMKDFTKTGDASKLVSCFESTNQSVGGHPHAN